MSGIQISENDFQRLEQLQSTGNYTQFYLDQYNLGSTVSGLYIPGPTGQGVFGSLSHNTSSDVVGEANFLAGQLTVSETISSYIIDEIRNSRDSDGNYYLPTLHRVLEVEIRAFNDPALAQYGITSAAYAGHDLINFYGVEGVEGAIQGGVGGWDFVDGFQAVAETYLPGDFYLFDGEILSLEEINDRGYGFYSGGTLIDAVGQNQPFIDSNGQVVNASRLNDVISYNGERFHPGQFSLSDGVYYVNSDQFGRIPVGLTVSSQIGLLKELQAEINVVQNQDGFLDGSFNRDEVSTIAILGEEKFAKLMYAIHGDADINLGAGSGIIRVTQSGQIIVVEEGRGTRLIDAITNNQCFLAGTSITMADGSRKPIEKIKQNDRVMSLDEKFGKMVASKVARTFRNEAKIILDFHGTFVTPGHVYYSPDSKRPSKFEPLIDILRKDGLIQHQDGTHIRATTGCEAGSLFDTLVWMAPKVNGAPAPEFARQFRLGTRVILPPKGTEATVMDIIVQNFGQIDADGRTSDGRHVSDLRMVWPFETALPQPEDYVMIRSQTTLEDIYRAADWERVRPSLPAPMVMDGGAVQPLSGNQLDQMPRNEPMAMKGLGTGGSPLAQQTTQAKMPSVPAMNRKQRKAMEAKTRKARKRLVH